MEEIFGKLKKVKELREYWKNEAHDFTPWLAEHLDLLGHVLGLSLQNGKTEVSVGSFSADILAQLKERANSNADRKVVIENQLEASDHDHLGKVITYASGTDAQIVIWIVSFARNEHIQAVEWLNANTKANKKFFRLSFISW